MKKIIPRSAFDLYYKAVEYAAAFFYGFPSRKMIVVGITGTKGKSTVVRLIGHILEQAGFKIGWTSSIDFKIGENIEANAIKMTMPGRFFMQKLLARMTKEGCQYALIETSSEGLVQYRHIGIDYDAAVLTNLSPEHIERHGGFENYKKAKLMLFDSISRSFKKSINGLEVKKTIIVNGADEKYSDFIKFPADQKFNFAILKSEGKMKKSSGAQSIFAAEINTTPFGSDFVLETPLGSVKINSRLLGKFNIENMLAAGAVALSCGIDLEIIKQAFASFEPIAGRMEKITTPKGFMVFIDYAHEPKSLESVYQYCRSLIAKENKNKLICVLGAAGGGRDKWKRPVMGNLAAKYCDYVILTNEDPYDENPAAILDEIEAGFSQVQNPYEQILDREEAIQKSLSLAARGDIVILTGKGSETCIMGPNNTKTPWNEKEVVEKMLRKLQNNAEIII